MQVGTCFNSQTIAKDSTVDFYASTGSPASMRSDFANSKLTNSFFTATSFRGVAVVGDTWRKGWTIFLVNGE